MTTTRSNDDPDVAAVETDSLIARREGKHEDFIDDCWDTVKLGFPIFLAMLSWVGVSCLYRVLVKTRSFLTRLTICWKRAQMKTTDSSLLGHVSASALARRIEAAYKAADIYTNPTITAALPQDPPRLLLVLSCSARPIASHSLSSFFVHR